MQIIYPEYYNAFHCLASACPDSCCKEWAVDVDDTSAEFYRSLPGVLGNQLRQVLQDTEDGTIMTITDGRCPMWREDGLCRIQAELGHDALCQTCREFPRLRHDYGDFIELGLELSCPEAARLIFASPAQKTVIESVPGGDPPEYDRDAMTVLLNSRKTFLDFLDSKKYPLEESLAVLLLYSHEVQSELDVGEHAVLDPEDCLEKARKFAKGGDISQLYKFFSGLEILTQDWRERLAAKPLVNPVDDSLRPLVRYIVQRYWLQTVSDLDLICRVKFIIATCLLINAMGSDPVETSQLFSKEIENDPDNVEAILTAAYTHPAFTDVALLGLLLNSHKD